MSRIYVAVSFGRTDGLRFEIPIEKYVTLSCSMSAVPLRRMPLFLSG